jgi:hypothetical protein
VCQTHWRGAIVAHSPAWYEMRDAGVAPLVVEGVKIQ